MAAKVLASAGILLTALGAVFVAYEVVKAFRGEKYEQDTWEEQNILSDLWKRYDRGRVLGMRSGLGLILLGSALQLAAIWM